MSSEAASVMFLWSAKSKQSIGTIPDSALWNASAAAVSVLAISLIIAHILRTSRW